MKIIDLTHVISPDMPVYPGTEQPVMTDGCSIEADGFLEKKIILYSHTGTHMDAPAHLIKDAKTLDQLSIEHFYGKAFLADLSNIKTRTITIEELEPYQDKIEHVEFLLLQTGWSRYWGDEMYFSDFHVLSLEAANWLTQFGLKGLGLDTISADEVEARDLAVHKIFLRNDTVIIENLTNLGELPRNRFIFSCFPLNFENADGSPVRAVAIIQ